MLCFSKLVPFQIHVLNKTIKEKLRLLKIEDTHLQLTTLTHLHKKKIQTV